MSDDLAYFRPLGSHASDVGRDAAAAFEFDLARLDRVEPTLGRDALDFVLTGQGSEVLQRLDDNREAVVTELDLRSWELRKPIAAGRRTILLGTHEWQPAAIWRYALVLSPLSAERLRYASESFAGTDRSPIWLRLLLDEYARFYAETGARRHTLSTQKLSALLRVSGTSLAPILDVVFDHRRDGSAFSACASPSKLPGFEDHLCVDVGERVREIRTLAPTSTVLALDCLTSLGLTGGAYYELAFSLSMTAGAAVRDAACRFLATTDRNRLMRRVALAFPRAKAARRRALMRLLPGVGVESGLETLVGAMNADGARAVTDTIERIADESLPPFPLPPEPADGGQGYAAMDGSYVLCPRQPALPPEKPLPRRLAKQLAAAVATYNSGSRRRRRRHPAAPDWAPLPEDAVDRLVRMTDAGAEKVADRGGALMLQRMRWLSLEGRAGRAAIAAVVSDHAFPVERLMRWAIRSGARGFEHGLPNLISGPGDACSVKSRLSPQFDLRSFSRLCATMGNPASAVGRWILGSYRAQGKLQGLEPRVVWPYFVEHIELIDEALAVESLSRGDREAEFRALQILAMFPRTPARFLQPLLRMAIGTRRAPRDLARQLLVGTHGLVGIVLPLLAHRRSQLRASAAEWLGSIGDGVAIRELLERVALEEDVVVRAAMLDAVIRLGGDVTGHLSPRSLQAEAALGLADGVPHELSWLDVEGFPPIHFRTGERVPTEVLQWWLILAHRMGLPGGCRLLDLYLDQLTVEGAALLGSHLLGAFAISKVRFPYLYRPDDETGYRSHIYAAFTSFALRPIASRGVLGLAVRAEAGGAVATGRRFLERHYDRPHHCIAVLSCLAAMRSRETVRFIARTSVHFGTNKIKAHAAALLIEIAGREGWSAAQLADVSAHHGGLGDDGTLRLAIGDASLVVDVNDRLEIGVTGLDGVRVTSFDKCDLPVRCDGISYARRDFAAARAATQRATTVETARLYDAFCYERTWSIDEWRFWLRGHPLVGRLVRCLAWSALDHRGRLTGSFVQLDAGDEPCAHRVRVANAFDMSPARANALVSHIRAAGAVPLFDQFRTPLVTADVPKASQGVLMDRAGWTVRAGRLRRAAAARGYLPMLDPDEDLVIGYAKSNTLVGLRAVIACSPHGVDDPAQNSRTLGSLRFEAMCDEGEHVDATLALVPRVMLSEALHDLDAITEHSASKARGPGVNPRRRADRASIPSVS